MLAAAGEPDIAEKLKKGHKAGDRTFKVHIDGYNLLPFLTTKGARSPRKGFIYFSDDGDLVALRFDNWKVVFLEQRAVGTLRVWSEPFVPLRVPKLFNLRTDPFERADITSNTYYEWLLENAYIAFTASQIVSEFLQDVQAIPATAKGRDVHGRLRLDRSSRTVLQLGAAGRGARPTRRAYCRVFSAS